MILNSTFKLKSSTKSDMEPVLVLINFDFGKKKKNTNEFECCYSLQW